MPANAGIQEFLSGRIAYAPVLDSGMRRNDENASRHSSRQVWKLSASGRRLFSGSIGLAEKLVWEE